MLASTVEMFRQNRDILSGWCFWTWKRGPTKSPCLSVVKVPDDWSSTMRWVAGGLFQKKPDASTAVRASKEFLRAVELENTEVDSRLIEAIR